MKSEYIDLSVVIPCHITTGNIEPIQRILENITPKNFEIILVNDMSLEIHTHDLRNLVKKYSKRIEIKYFEVSFKNPGATRNFGIQNATGNWITFWDCDDFPSPQLYVEAIEKSTKDVEIIIGQYNCFDICKNEIVYHSSDMNVSDVAMNPGVWRMLFKRSIIPDLAFPEISLAEDHNLLSKIDFAHRKLSFSRICLYNYIVNQPTQLTKSKEYLNDLLVASLNTLEFERIKNSFFNRLLFWSEIISYFTRADNKSRIKLFLKLFNRTNPISLTHTIRFIPPLCFIIVSRIKRKLLH